MNLFKKLRNHSDLSHLDDSTIEQIINDFNTDPEDFINNLDFSEFNNKEKKAIRKYLKV